MQQFLAPMSPGDGRASVCDVCNVSTFARALDWQKTEGVGVADADQTGFKRRVSADNGLPTRGLSLASARNLPDSAWPNQSTAISINH